MSSVFEAIKAMSAVMQANQGKLSELDAAIGDGDHGVNMARGFKAACDKLAASDPDDVGAGIKLVGITLISTVGGASGPLYGTAFMRAGAALSDQSNITLEMAANMFKAAIQGIKDRGKSKAGEKTMLDALEPAYETFVQEANRGKNLLECLEAATFAAGQGVEYTKTIIATKGRASYLGTRSIGHQDAGATSSYLLLASFTEFMKQGVREA